MTNCESQSLLRIILQRKGDEAIQRWSTLRTLGFVNLGSTRPDGQTDLPRGLRVFCTRAPTSGNS